VARHRAEEENIQLKRALKQRYNFEHIVGKSEAMLKIFEPGRPGRASRSTVLLQGESGTGKELIAKAIHLNSQRPSGPSFPSIQAPWPPDLLESTLFGHVKGAFDERQSLPRRGCSKSPTMARCSSTRLAP